MPHPSQHGPYRTATPPAKRWAPPGWWRRLSGVLCAVRGHRWLMLRRNRERSWWFGHLHSLGGMDAVCARCHLVWLDARPLADHCGVCHVEPEVPCDYDSHLREWELAVDRAGGLEAWIKGRVAEHVSPEPRGRRDTTTESEEWPLSALRIGRRVKRD